MLKKIKFSGFGLYCGLLLSISAFSTDIVLPVLFAISNSLEVSVQQVQLIIPVYMLALGLANPFYGGFSDRTGRKPAIFAGLSIYLLGTLVCLFADNINTMLAGRFLQGFGAASAPVVCRAMIRDRFEGLALAQNMAVASMFFALGPMLAPVAGYLFYALFGWHAVFVALILFGTGMFIATIRQPETLPAEARTRRPQRSMVEDILIVFTHRQSLYFIALSCLCIAMILSFLSHAPIVFDELGASPGRFAALFAMCSIGIVAGQVINHRLISRVGPSRAAMYGALVIAMTSFIIMLCAYTKTLNEVVFTGLMFAFNSCYLIMYSNFASLTLEPHKELAGTAAAMFGFASYVIGSMLAILITLVTDTSIFRWSVCFLLLALMVAAGAARWNAKHINPTESHGGPLR